MKRILESNPFFNSKRATIIKRICQSITFIFAISGLIAMVVIFRNFLNNYDTGKLIELALLLIIAGLFMFISFKKKEPEKLGTKSFWHRTRIDAPYKILILIELTGVVWGAGAIRDVLTNKYGGDGFRYWIWALIILMVISALTSSYLLREKRWRENQQKNNLFGDNLNKG